MVKHNLFRSLTYMSDINKLNFVIARKILIIIPLLSFVTLLYSQKYAFTGYSISEGLPNASINKLYQDSSGYIWIGTNGGGLSRFDGYSFKNYSAVSGLDAINVTSIIQTPERNILIGTENGLFFYNGNNFAPFAYSDSIGNNISQLYYDRDNRLWVLTHDKGIYLIEKTAEDSLYLFNLAEESSLKTKNFIGISEDCMGRIWLSSDSGVVVLTYENGVKIHSVSFDGILPKDVVTTMVPGKNCEMWCGTANSGIYLVSYDSATCFLKRSYTNYFDNIDDNIVSLLRDKSGKIWVGTDDQGIINVDYPFLKKLDIEKGLESNMITDLLEDSEGNLWIATKGNGIQVFRGWQFAHYNSESGLPDGSIHFITEDAEGSYWCSNPGGLCKIMRRYDQIRVFNVLLEGDLSLAQINLIAFPQPTEFIIGTESMGIFSIHNNQTSVIDVTSGLRSNKINCVYVESPNDIWIGTKKGLSKLKNGVIEHTSCFDKMPDNEVNTIIKDNKGRIWAATTGGLLMCSADTFKIYKEKDGLEHLRINSIVENVNGNIWIGTLGGGLYIYESESNEIKSPGFNNLLGSSNIYGLLILNDTVLLAATDKGFDKILFKSPDSLQTAIVRNYSGINGFVNLQNSLNTVIKDRSGEVWFGTNAGLTCYKPDLEEILNEKPKINITDIDVNFKDVDWESKGIEKPLWNILPEGLKLKYSENYIDFRYSGIYYSDDLEYQYFLEGLDKGWSKKTKQRNISFSKLNSGKYNLRVRAISNSGLISDEANYAFIIKPPFWQTWWFITAVVILAVFLIYNYIKYRERKLKHDKEVLEKTVQERTVEIRNQKEKIETQKKELTDSIEYAKRIQDAVISQPGALDGYIEDYFILFLPRDIVSGDFYWFGELDNKLIFSVADCTGHGVPGAFMSMLGIRLLNEIILERGISVPNEILNQLRSSVIDALHKSENTGETKDGMDMSICSYDKKKGKLQYSGAYNPLWIIRDGELIVVKADRMPVAIYIKMNEFSCHELECKKGDIIYLFSDGYADQFGGPEQKKYNSKTLKNTLLTIAGLSMEEQKQHLLKEFEEWKGSTKQIDDVALIGIKIK